MAVNSKQKGARFERLLASKFRENGYDDARRTAQYCGSTGDASDVTGLPGIHVEAKHQEKMQLYAWMAQAVRDAQAGGGKSLIIKHQPNFRLEWVDRLKHPNRGGIGSTGRT